MGAKDRRIAELEAENVTLKKHSGNSSKPPSSDIVKPSLNPNNKKKRKQGAQPGHKQHLRKPIDPNLIDTIITLELTTCPDCGHPLALADIAPKTIQQIEIIEKPVTITEYQQLMYWCRSRGLSSGVVEGFNNNVKLTARKAYGFRTFETLQIALFHALGRLPEPKYTHRCW